MLNGKQEKRGFHRDRFFEKAETTFDKVTGYRRNYVESYKGRKAFKKDKKGFYLKLMGLPANEKALAFKLLREAQINMPYIPTSGAQLAISAFKKLKRGLDIALKSGSIEI